jgi:hypothetical protein
MVENDMELDFSDNEEDEGCPCTMVGCVPRQNEEDEGCPCTMVGCVPRLWGKMDEGNRADTAEEGQENYRHRISLRR